MMMLEKNNLEIAGVMSGWLDKALPAAASIPLGVTRGVAAQEASPDDWMREVRGTRARIDACSISHSNRNGLPLLHILNYLSTYAAAHKVPAGQVGAVGTFYGLSVQASIPLPFNDGM